MMATLSRPARPPYVFAMLLAAFGAVILLLGLRLVVLGGSYYYLIAGSAEIAAAILLMRRSIWGDRVLATVLFGTLVWALQEVGFSPWGLVPRLCLPAAFGLWLLLPWSRRGLVTPGSRSPVSPAGAIAIACIGVMVAAFLWKPSAKVPGRATSLLEATPSDSDGWYHYGNTLRGTRFSRLTKIDPRNVSRLQVAWIHRSGDTRNPASAGEATPLYVDGMLYTCTPNSVVIALDAISGKERWRFDPKIKPAPYVIRNCRGVAFYRSNSTNSTCPARVISATIDSRLIALDAATGVPCRDFGADGQVSLREGIGEYAGQFQYPTSPATIVKDHVVIGTLVLDNQSTDMPSGVIRSFDPLTGQLQWAWDMGAPERIGAPPPGETYTPSTPNSWTIFAADEELGLVYVPTGSPSPDFFGAKRRPFDEKYSASIVALDVQTGRPRWSFQTVHHDVWDYDVSSQPALVDLPDVGGSRPALVQATKRGQVFVLDRRTGDPIVPVVEREVPQGAAKGDWVSKTQPYSALAVQQPLVTEASMWGMTLVDQLLCRIQFRQSRYEGEFTPIGLQPTIFMPGQLGGMNWGSLSIDEDTGVAVANYNTFPWRGWLVPRNKARDQGPAWHYGTLMAGTPYAVELSPWLGPLQVPCFQPPWGALTAINLSTREVLWDRPLGTGRDSGPKGMRSGIGLPMGVPSTGGTVTTRSGLIFISGTLDQYVRAFDLHTGKELWKSRLPAGGQATPMTYLADGRQFVVVTAGGNSIAGTQFGDYTIAYALPRQ